LEYFVITANSCCKCFVIVCNSTLATWRTHKQAPTKYFYLIFSKIWKKEEYYTKKCKLFESVVCSEYMRSGRDWWLDACSHDERSPFLAFLARRNFFVPVWHDTEVPKFVTYNIEKNLKNAPKNQSDKFKYFLITPDSWCKCFFMVRNSTLATRRTHKQAPTKILHSILSHAVQKEAYFTKESPKLWPCCLQLIHAISLWLMPLWPSPERKESIYHTCSDRQFFSVVLRDDTAVDVSILDRKK